MNTSRNHETLTTISAKDNRSCLAICLAVNLPWDDISSVRKWYPSSASVHSIIDSPDGDKFIIDLIEAIRGPLDPKDFVLRIFTLLVCYRAKEHVRYFLPLTDRDYLLEFSKLLHHEYSDTQQIGEVLERVTYSTIRSLGNHYPDLVNTPGLLPMQINTSMMDSMLSRPLDIYCCIRSLVSCNHKSLLWRVCEISKIPASGHFRFYGYPSDSEPNDSPVVDLSETSESESLPELDEDTYTDFESDSFGEIEESGSSLAGFVIGDDREDSDDSWQPGNGDGNS